MSEDIPSAASSSSHSSPAKTNWVQFDDEGRGGDNVDAGSAAGGGSGGGSPSKSVGSARGTVNSLASAKQMIQHQQSSEQPGALAVSEIQVVDEHNLRKKNSVMSTSDSSSIRTASTARMSDSMDNVNLQDDQQMSPQHQQQQQLQQQPVVIRGKRFSPGEVIVTLLPVNEKFPWVTPAQFRPELVPEELMAPVLTLTVEEYVQTMEKLTSDTRFTLYNILYKRILIVWIVTAFSILLALLFSGFQGIELFTCGVLWLIMNASAIFFCMWVKLKLNKMLEKCLASVNTGLLKHNIMLGVDDRGKLSCHKVNLCFIYFDATNCIKKLEAVLAEKPEENGQNGEATFDRESYLRDDEDFQDVEVVVSGRAGVKVNRKEERAEKLYLHYLQRWAKDYLRRRLDWVIEDIYGRTEYAANTNPRHLNSALCPCQYIEEHLRNKRQRESLNPCTISANPCHWCD